MMGCYEGVCRPGGYEITNRAISFCQFHKGDRLLDIGCGKGGTVRHLRQKWGVNVTGIDVDSEAIKLGREHFQETENLELLVVGNSKELPFQREELDGILYECSFSKMEEADQALEEGSRVLKSGGYLILSDFYAKGTPHVFSGLLGRMETKEELLRRIEKSSFQIMLFEDYSTEMKTMLGQMLLDHGCEAFYKSIGGGPEGIKRVKPGYCLIIGRKI